MKPMVLADRCPQIGATRAIDTFKSENTHAIVPAPVICPPSSNFSLRPRG
jgi:hypothetical protein